MINTFKEVIVVEGNHDKARIHERFPEADVIITNGAEVPRETLVALKELNAKRGLILLLDPDGPGERIRRLINDAVGTTKHAFIDKAQCVDQKKQKVGIEHARLDIIEAALLTHVKHTKFHRTMTRTDLRQRGLLGGANAGYRRANVCVSLRIGQANGKTFLKKLNMFGITPAMLDEVME